MKRKYSFSYRPDSSISAITEKETYKNKKRGYTRSYAKKMSVISCATAGANGIINDPAYILATRMKKAIKMPYLPHTKILDADGRHIRTIDSETRKVIWDIRDN